MNLEQKSDAREAFREFCTLHMSAGIGVQAEWVRSVSLSNGDRYEGAIVGGTFEGKGIYYFKDGPIYFGYFHDGFFHGEGSIIFKSGTLFRGEFERGLRVEEGTFLDSAGNEMTVDFTLPSNFLVRVKYANGNSFEGEIDREGLQVGTFANKTGVTMTGEARNGELNGQIDFRSQQFLYKGQTLKNKLHGPGIIKYPNGDRFRGEFDQNSRTGSGTYIFANGDIYEGFFRSNLFHGHGKLTFMNGDVYEGDFKEGKMTGQGVYSQTKMDLVYKGSLIDGKRHGFGVLKKGKSILFTGNWANNDPVRDVKVLNNSKSNETESKSKEVLKGIIKSVKIDESKDDKRDGSKNNQSRSLKVDFEESILDDLKENVDRTKFMYRKKHRS